MKYSKFFESENETAYSSQLQGVRGPNEFHEAPPLEAD